MFYLTQRLGLPQWSELRDKVLQEHFNDAFAKLDDRVVVIGVGAFSERPAAGGSGQFFCDTATNIIYFDTGSKWVTVGASLDNLIVKPKTGVTAKFYNTPSGVEDVIEILDQNNKVLACVNHNGDILANGTFIKGGSVDKAVRLSSADLSVTGTTSGSPAIAVKGSAGAGTIFQVSNSSGTVVLSVNQQGAVVCPMFGFGTTAQRTASSPQNGFRWYDTTLRADFVYNDGWQSTFVLSEVVNVFYPVGTIYESVRNTNPGTFLPGTTWVAWGAGRVSVGAGSNGTTNYSTVEATGGAESVTLSAAQSGLVAHSHTMNHDHASVSATTASAGAHSHTMNHGHTDGSAGAHSHTMNHGHTAAATGNAGAHTHTMNHGHTGSSASAGAHTHTIDHGHAGGATSVAGSHNHTAPMAGGVNVMTDWGFAIGWGNPQGNRPTTYDGAHQHTFDVPAMSGSSGSAGAHSHTVSVNDYSGSTSSAGAHTHTINNFTGSTGSDGAHTHTVSVDLPNFTGSTGSVTAAGATSSHENRMPYIVSYKWKRTA